MESTAAAALSNELVQELDAELTGIANAQFETPEFRLLFDLRLTMERARFFATQMVLYNVNRRDCWAYVQARAPWDVKRTIWQHEQDELYYDPRGASDHRELMSKEARALGMNEQDLAAAEPTPLIQAAFFGFIQINVSEPWLAAFTAAHFLERRNNSNLIKGGGFSERWRNKVVRELKVDPSLLISSNIHVEADMDHSDMIWEMLAVYIVDRESYDCALSGAKKCAIMDRAYRAAMAHGMLALAAGG